MDEVLVARGADLLIETLFEGGGGREDVDRLHGICDEDCGKMESIASLDSDSFSFIYFSYA